MCKSLRMHLKDQMQSAGGALSELHVCQKDLSAKILQTVMIVTETVSVMSETVTVSESLHMFAVNASSTRI